MESIPYEQKGIRIPNIMFAACFSFVSIWLCISDFSKDYDLMLQSSASLNFLALGSFLLFLCSLFLSALPKRYVISLCLLSLLRMSIGWPLNMYVDNSTACKIFSTLLVLVSLRYLYVSLNQKATIWQRPWMQFKSSFLMILAGLFLGILAIPATVIGSVKGLANLGGDYIDIKTSGIILRQRLFTKGDRKVLLVGTMHIGDESYYERLEKELSTPTSGKKLVLTEGVKDKNKILPENFASGKTYQKLAKLFGLTKQKAFGQNAIKRPTKPGGPTMREKDGVVYLNADIDISELSEKHQTTLVTLLEMMDFDKVQDLLMKQPPNISEEEMIETFKVALLDQRNQEVIKVMQEHEASYSEIFIPWGAAHLPGIEDELIKLGYQASEEKWYTAVDFSKVLAKFKEKRGKRL